MDIKALLTTFDGRIGRKQFWIGILCMIVLAILLIVVLGFAIGLILPEAWVSLIGNLIMLYPAAALMTKRLHDRDKPQSPWLYIFIVPGLLLNVMSALGIGFTTLVVEGTATPIPSSMFTYLLMTVSGIVGIWALIELGFLRGTEGANQFGEDPVA